MPRKLRDRIEILKFDLTEATAGNLLRAIILSLEKTPDAPPSHQQSTENATVIHR
ncbi:MAG TPA: hypothetical protein VMB02_16050 [Candidatus Aquilonibacter sp.]|nr:hypothetical protein [Candidatus Aquilonibacter sp.]